MSISPRTVWDSCRRVVSNSPAAAGPLHKVVIDVGAPLAAGYTVPGQFVQVKVGDSKPGFFAIASAPGAHAGSGQLEFLIKGAPGEQGAKAGLQRDAALSRSLAHCSLAQLPGLRAAVPRPCDGA